MPFRGNLWMVAVLAVVVVLLLPGVGLTLDQATPTSTETDQVNATFAGSVSVSPDQNAIGYYDNETVVNNETDTTLREGTDYDWNVEDGSVTFENSSRVSDGDTINVTYAYNVGSDDTGEVRDIYQNAIGSWFGVLFLVVCIGALLGFVFENGGGF